MAPRQIAIPRCRKQGQAAQGATPTPDGDAKARRAAGGADLHAGQMRRSRTDQRVRHAPAPSAGRRPPASTLGGGDVAPERDFAACGASLPICDGRSRGWDVLVADSGISALWWDSRLAARRSPQVHCGEFVSPALFYNPSSLVEGETEIGR